MQTDRGVRIYVDRQTDMYVVNNVKSYINKNNNDDNNVKFCVNINHEKLQSEKQL